MNINQLVAELSKHDVSLSLEGDDILISYEGDEISSSLLDTIKNRKQELVVYLKKYTDQHVTEDIPVAEECEYYPLSSSQYRLWILSQFSNGLTAYNMPGSARLQGEYNIHDLKRAILSVLDRHEILRTVFRKDNNGQIYQKVLSAEIAGFTIGYENYSNENDPEQCAKEYIRKSSYEAFDLENGPLLQVSLLQLNDKEYVLYYNMHHIISDGWSMEVIKRDILAYYQHYAEGKVLSLPPLRIQYKDYAVWQLQQFRQDTFIKAKDFWLSQLSGELPLLELPSFRKRPKVKTYNGAGLKTYISKQDTSALRKFTTEHDSTLFISLLAIWNILLHKYTSGTDILIGSPVAGRDHIELEGQIGCFVNTLVLRNQVDPQDTFVDFYHKIRSNALKSIEHQVYPFDRLVEELNLTKDLSRSPVFDVMLTLQNTGERRTADIPDEKASVIEETGHTVAKFDLDIFFSETGGNLSFQINYNTDLYDAAVIKGIISGFKQILSDALSHPHKTINAIEYLSAQQRDRLVSGFNQTRVVYPEGKTVIGLFTEQVALTPQNTVVSFGGKKYTYKQLDELSTRLSAFIRSNYGIKKGDIVGIQLRRSEWVIISILAVLKSGGVYVPIDAELPDSRKAFIAADTDLKLLITETAFSAAQDSFLSASLYVDNCIIPDATIDVQDNVVLSPDDLAYIIYTSGSTGNPKGVMIAHSSLTNYLLWSREYYLTSDLANTNFGLFTSLSFDLTITSLFLPLISGGSLNIATAGNNVLDTLQEYLESDISCIKLTPAHISLLDGLALKSDRIELAIVGGEELRKDHIAILKDINPAIRIINEYGPTESTVGCTIYDVHADDESVLIGRPIANTAIYIVDEYNNLQAEGVIGEVCIGGAGLAKGYLNQPVLTAEKFISNPFGAGRIYKTGDIGRWLPDGNLEYKGRKDDQVKIKGYRIEPGEIEHVLSGYAGLKEGVIGVVTDQDRQHRLCAYLVANEHYDKAALIKHLKAVLPAYMVPDYYVTIDAIPLSSNGKVDRKQLPLPDVTGRDTSSFMEPQTPVQIAVAAIWQQVLGVEKISLDDNFYDLGGDSLRVIRLISQFHRMFDVKLTADVLFEHVTLEAHAALIASSKTEKHTDIPLLPPRPAYAVSDAQQKLWVISQVEEGSVAYNMPGSVRLTGDYNIADFRRAIVSVVERHEILRTVFRKNTAGIVEQVVLTVAESGFDIAYESYAGHDAPEVSARAYIQKDAYQPFDLENGPLLRAGLLQLSSNDYILYYNMHHIISDGWSMDILARDILAYYKHYTAGTPLELPALRIQYKDYAAWQLAQLETEAYRQHKQYWLSKLSGELPVLDMPTSKARPVVKSYNGRKLSTYLSKDSSDAVRSYVAEKKGTLFMFLIASLKVLFHRYTGQEDILLGSPVAGREHAALEDQIGFYINTLALRSTVNGKLSFDQFYEQVKQLMLAAYEHDMYPLDRLVDELDVNREGGRNALFDVRVVLQNTANGKELKLATVNDKEVIRDHGQAMAKFDMLFIFHEAGGHIGLELTYDSDVYDHALMTGLLRHYRQLVDKLVEDGGSRIEEIDYFSVADRSAVSHHVEVAALAIPEGQSILELFAKQVNSNPSDTALVAGDIKWTYRELDEYTSQLAWYLKNKYNIHPDDLVGIKLTASHWSVMAILGILKAGAAYVPMDAELPVERVQYLVTDTRIKTLIMLSTDSELAQAYQVDTFMLDKEWDTIRNLVLTASLPAPAASDLAYVIYTSGSTGQPKGVMISHGNLADYVNGLFANTAITSCERFALMSSIATDLGNTVLYGALLSGGALHILPKEQLLVADEVHDYFRQHTIDCIKIVPTHWIALSRGEELLLPAKMIIFGGDVLPLAHVEAIRAQKPGVAIVNHYGPTETTIGKLLINIDNDVTHTKIPIGKPFSSTAVYVVDKQLRICPIGVPGELLIGGKGVAGGYLNKPELTEKQFIKPAFAGKEEVFYRTGDLVKMLPDGNIEFLGRIDNQVKIRGYRIELGDVENAISAVAGIESVLVLARASAGGDKELVAYYTTSGNVNEPELRTWLQGHLPSYMVPAYCIAIKEFPLTSNGKINRKALPAPEEQTQAGESGYIAPRTPQEEALVAVWESVLKRKEISVNANFFDLGGDSIKGILIVSRLKQKGYELKIADLLQTPVLSSLTEKLTLLNRGVTQALVTGNVALTPIQRAFLTSDVYKNKSHYNQSVALETTSRIDQALLDKSLGYLTKHHDALRMVFRQDAGAQWIQENKGLAHKAYTLELYDLSAQDIYQEEMRTICDALQAGIDLQKGPLFKAALFRLKDKDCVLLIAHHLVVDGVSWRILLEDLEYIYHSLEKKTPVKLPEKTDAFQHWAKMLGEYAVSDSLKQEQAYWQNIVSKETTPLYAVPVDAARGIVKHTSFILDKETVELLQTSVHRVYNTEINDILLAGLGIGVLHAFGNDSVILDMEGHGREHIMEGVDITRTVGWFTSMYPFLLTVDRSADLISSLIEVKESLRKVPQKGIGYGILRYLADGFNQVATPDIIFNYLGDFGSTATLASDKHAPLFRYSGEYKGAESSTENDTLGNKLRVSGMIVNGALRISVAYNNALYGKEKITALVDAYKDALVKIIGKLSVEEQRYLTPSDLTFKGLSVRALSDLNRNNNVEDIYRLSPLQEGLYYHWISGKDKATYCAQHSYRLHMPGITVNNIRKSYAMLIARHPILRTGFKTINGELLQIVRKEVADSFAYEHLSAIATDDLELYVSDYKSNDRARGFQLEQDSLMRLSVLDLGEAAYEFVWCNHHILMDGWCSSILINEFYQILMSLEMGHPLSLPAVKPYASYIKWLEKVNKDASIAYWREFLADYNEKAVLPFKKAADNSGYIPRQENLRIESQLLERLRKVCAQFNVTENNFIQSAWGYLLSKYNNTRDVVYGSVVSGRPGEIAGVENMVGLFINTIPLRVSYDNDMTVSGLLEKQRDAFIAGLDHHYLNLSAIQSVSLLGTELFDHIYVFENYALNELGADTKDVLQGDAGKGKLSIVSRKSFTETHYDFDILVAPLKDSILIELRYNSNVYKEADMIRMRQHLENVLTGFIEAPQMLLKDIDYITASESEEIRAFNDTAAAYPQYETILDQFDAQVRKAPDRTAVVFETKRLSYHELDELSNQLARCLITQYGLAKGDLAGIQLDRSCDMLVAILGIMKAGGAYVPLDMQYPAERVQYIKEDSNYKVCIDQSFIAAFYAARESDSGVRPSLTINGSDPAYGIYTSGSTGHPKGVLNTHEGLYNRLLWMRDDLKITDADILLQKTPYTFDVSVWELLMMTVSGCQLVFAKPEGHKDPEYLQELIQSAGITVMHFVPSMLGIFLESVNPVYCKGLTHVVCSGEALPASMVEDFKVKLPWVRIHNLYGPTEAAIDVTYIDLTDVDTKTAGVTIGKPVANTKIYIVHKDMTQQPVGIAGELLIEGIQVSLGYLNRAELNQEKFIDSPFIRGAHVYRTGDLAKWLPNGEIAYVGRMDDQVKIRGNRIELGEIETAIQSSGYVHNVAVIVKETKTGHKYLVAYLLPNEQYIEDALYTYLGARLPEFMVPARIILLHEFPLTSSGKVNRKALSAMEVGQAEGNAYVAPRDVREAELVLIWEQVLGYTGPGIFDDFFRIGGDSILAIRLISKINQQYNANLSIAQLYEYNNIAALSAYIGQQIASQEQEQSLRDSIESDIRQLKERILSEIDDPQDIEDIYPMRDIQKGMVILSDLSQGTGVYHDQFVFQIPMVDKEIFHKAFSLLVSKHATLRTQLDLATYSSSVQIVKKEISFDIDYRDISHLDTKEKKVYIHEYMLAERKRPFTAGDELLWRISLFVINDTSCVFLFQFHHAILDGWSLASLNTELFGIYRQLTQGLPVRTVPLKASNRDAVIAELYDKRNTDIVDFWKAELAGVRKPEMFSSESRAQKLTWLYDYKFKHLLEERCKTDEVSPKTVIYGAFIYALKLISHQNDFVVGMLSNNRPVVEDGDKLLGCFLNTIPVRNKFEPLALLSLSHYFKEIENNLSRIRKNERLTLYEISRIMNEKPAGGSPFFDILFNYVNFHIYDTLGLDTDKDYKKSLEEGIGEDSFELTNTSLDFTANSRGTSLALTLRLKRGLKHELKLDTIRYCVETILKHYTEHPATGLAAIEDVLYTAGKLVRYTDDANEVPVALDKQEESNVPQYVPAAEEKSDIEASLIAIWEKILEHNRIGLHDNFFRIGGDSILVVKLKHELSKAYNRPVNLVDLFNHTTISAQAKLFAAAIKADNVSAINEIKF